MARDNQLVVSSARLFLLGLLAAAVWIAVEAWLIARGREGVDFSRVVASAGPTYLVVLGLVAALLGAVARVVVGRLSDDPGCDGPRIAAAAYLPLVLLVLGGAYVNKVHLPGFTTPPSLLFNAAALLVTGGAVYLIERRVLTREAWRRVVSAATLPRLAACALAVVVLVALAGLFGSSRPRRGGHGGGNWPDGSPPPNVVFILIDTLRADHLGAYGYERDTSPTLDRIARGATLFENAIAQSSWTRPSVASIFTSLYPSQHKANRATLGLPDEPVTLAEALSDFGYRTAAFSANPNVSTLFGFAQGFDHFYSPSMPEPRLLTILGSMRYRFERVFNDLSERAGLGLTLGRSGGGSDDERISLAARAWLEADGAGPFFLYLHYLAPHDPYAPPAEFRERFLEGPAPKHVSTFPERPDVPIVPARSIAADDLEAMVALYDAEIAYVDALIADMVEFLDSHGSWEDSFVVVASDHGEEFYDHESWGHGRTLYEEMVRVPLIIRTPGQGEGRREETPVSLVDIYPTILHHVGAPLPREGIAGRPLFEQGSGPRPEPPTAYAELITPLYDAQAVRSRSHKLIRMLVFGSEDDGCADVYDLEADPREREPATAGVEGLRSLFEEHMQAYRSLADGAVTETREVHIDEKTRAELEALGYLGDS